MEYVRCECEACKQMIVLPGEVRLSECRCPTCGKPVAIPEHEAPAFVHRMRGRLLTSLAILGLLWLAWAVVSSVIDARKPAPRTEPERPAHGSPLPVQAKSGSAPDGAVPGSIRTIRTETAEPAPRVIDQNATASAQPDPNAG